MRPAAVVLVLTLSTQAAAQQCERYVAITSPCVGLAGPVTRIVAGRACVYRHRATLGDLSACRRLRKLDQAEAGSIREQLTEALTQCRAAQIAPAPQARARPSWYERPIVALLGGIVIGVAGAIAGSVLISTR